MTLCGYLLLHVCVISMLSLRCALRGVNSIQRLLGALWSKRFVTDMLYFLNIILHVWYFNVRTHKKHATAIVKWLIEIACINKNLAKQRLSSLYFNVSPWLLALSLRSQKEYLCKNWGWFWGRIIHQLKEKSWISGKVSIFVCMISVLRVQY